MTKVKADVSRPHPWLPDVIWLCSVMQHGGLLLLTDSSDVTLKAWPSVECSGWWCAVESLTEWELCVLLNWAHCATAACLLNADSGLKTAVYSVCAMSTTRAETMALHFTVWHSLDTIIIHELWSVIRIMDWQFTIRTDLICFYCVYSIYLSALATCHLF